MKQARPYLAIAVACLGGCTAPTSAPSTAGDSAGPPPDDEASARSSCQRDADGGTHPTLQAALDAAGPGDVVFACNRPEGHPGPLILRQDVTLVGPALVVGGTGPAVHVVAGHATLVQMTLDGGTGAVEPRLDGDTFGGVLAAWEAEGLTLRDSVLRGGEADWGGCLAAPRAGSAYLHRTDISDCTAAKLGGGVWIRSGTLEDSVVRDSRAPYGGGIAVRSIDRDDGDVHLPGTVLHHNHGDVQGGGMLITGPSRVIGGTVRDNTSEQGAGVLLSSATGGWSNGTASGNEAAVGGGGVFISGGTPMLHRVSVVDNQATGASLPDSRGVGGGIWIAGDRSTEVLLHDVLLEGNAAPWGGGLMIAGGSTWEEGPQVEVYGGALRGHRATDGGGAALVGAFLRLEDTTITQNVSEAGGGVLLERSRLDALGSTWSDNLPTDVESEAGTFTAPATGDLVCDAAGCTEPDAARE